MVYVYTTLFDHCTLRLRFAGGRTRQTAFDDGGDDIHYPTRPVDKDKAEQELVVNIKKATSPEETAPKQKHVRSAWYLQFFSHRLTPNRMHRVYLGLSLLDILLERTSSSAYFGG